MPVLDANYFDHASSTPVRPEIIEALSEYYPTYYANSDSLHDAGMRIHTMVEKSREAIAKLLDVKAQELFFTSGATEANNILIKGIAFAYQNRGKHLITSKVEHASVLESFQDLERFFGFDVTYLPVNSNGYVEVSDLKDALRKDTTLVSLMAVNNETGTIFPIQDYAKVIHDSGRTLFHVDAVQALGKIDLSLDGVDAASFSAHKIRGVKGSGLLYKKSNIECHPLITGGQQEGGLRPGTPNALHHILFAKTLRLALDCRKMHEAEIMNMRTALIDAFKMMPDIVINSPQKDCSPYILNISCLNVPSQVMLNWLNQNGLCVSAMATCSSRQYHPSHVLSAMDIQGKRLDGVLRISLGNTNTQEACAYLIAKIQEGIQTYGQT